MIGHIKISRKILKWEWYQDSQMFHMFMHLLIKANHKDGRFQGIEVKRGQILTGRLKLALALGFSEMQVRTCLKKLKSTGEITTKVTNKYSIITVCKYDSYQTYEAETNQQDNQQNNQPITSNQPASNQQLTTNNNDNKNNSKNVKNDIITPSAKVGFEPMKIVSPHDHPDWRKDCEEFFLDTKFKKDFSLTKKIPLGDLEKMMSDFLLELNLVGDYKNVPGLKKHFINSYNKKERNGNLPFDHQQSTKTQTSLPTEEDYENYQAWKDKY